MILILEIAVGVALGLTGFTALYFAALPYITNVVMGRIETASSKMLRSDTSAVASEDAV